MAISLRAIGTYDAGVFDEGAAEIVAHDPATQRVFVINGATNRVDVLSVANATAPEKLFDLDLSTFGAGPTSVAVRSVAVRNDVVAVAVHAAEPDAPGRVAFFDTDGASLGSVEVGVLPDMLTFSPDGTRILVANEGEFTDEVDPVGSISVIDLSGGVGSATVAHIGFEGFDDRAQELRDNGVRLFPGKTVSQSLEPEYIAVSPDGTRAFVTLQENNAVAVLDLATNTALDILPLGSKDYSRGTPTLTEYDFKDLPTLGTAETGQVFRLGGFSGLQFEGVDDATGRLKFVTLGDRGPNGDPVDVDGDGVAERPFLLPDYQARIVRFELDPDSGELDVTQQLLLTREDGTTPITGLPNIPGVDEEPVDPSGDPLSYDPLGADLEGITIAKDGSFWTVDEYRPAIYHFAADGTLIDRFVPEGTGALGGQPAGTYGEETLPEAYSSRIANRGFEAVALDQNSGILYAFIQTPLANPDSATSRNSDNIRILGIDTATGEAVAEYVYVLEDPRIGGSVVDKIGDAVFLGNGKFYVVERDSDPGDTAKKLVFEVDLKGATNLLDPATPALPAGETIESLTPDELADLGIATVDKLKVTNLPSLGYTPNDKTEGLAVLPDGRLAVLNDNDFGLFPGAEKITLGLVSFDGGNGLDASDRDDAINIENWPVHGLYMPDGIASYSVGGKTYYVTANEGDARGEEERLKDVTLDPDAFPNAEELQSDEQLGRLEVSTIDGDLDGDGDLDRIFTYGGRSFSILDSAGNLVFDSGDQFEQKVAELFPDYFNVSNTDNDLDSRSDNKGPEPEGVTVGAIGGRTYAFIGLERMGGVMVYDVTDPRDPQFIQYANNRDFTGDPEAGTAGDLGPEGLIFVKAGDSPTETPLVIVGNEVSGTTTIYEIDAPAMRMAGTAGRDVLVGDGGGDTLLGRDGNDRLSGLGGNDRMLGRGGRRRPARRPGCRPSHRRRRSGQAAGRSRQRPPVRPGRRRPDRGRRGQRRHRGRNRQRQRRGRHGQRPDRGGRRQRPRGRPGRQRSPPGRERRRHADRRRWPGRAVRRRRQRPPLWR